MVYQYVVCLYCFLLIYERSPDLQIVNSMKLHWSFSHIPGMTSLDLGYLNQIFDIWVNKTGRLRLEINQDSSCTLGPADQEQGFQDVSAALSEIA